MQPGQTTWEQANQRYLMASLAGVRACVERRLADGSKSGDVEPASISTPSLTEFESLDAPPALERLVRSFALSDFERSLVLLCAGPELDAQFAPLLSSTNHSAGTRSPTFGLAMSILPGSHWSALTPGGPLRRWRLIEVIQQPGVTLVNSPLRIDERILHYLAGIQYLDERIEGIIERVTVQPLVPSHQQLAGRIADTLRKIFTAQDQRLPMVQLCGVDEVAKRSIMGAACDQLGMRLFAVWAENLPSTAVELEAALRLWEREAILASGALCVVADTLDRSDLRAMIQVTRLLERVISPVFLSTQDRWRPMRRAVETFDVARPTAEEQVDTWNHFLAESGVNVNGFVKQLASQFTLSVPEIQSSVRQAVSGDQTEDLSSRLWSASRSQVRPRLEDLAQRLEPRATWTDLILPKAEKAVLKQISSHVAFRAVVYGDWGFAQSSSRGLGLCALFSGASGTGKTMAAEVLASELRLDLYRIDLSCVVSKYIGETEKNLRRVFEAAEEGGAILFFDEADALFGKRSEVKDSHDRYANIEINYLLQRMESYSGLSVLATNMKAALDPAFLRRLRFVINFPFPDAVSRAAIWQTVFPSATPTNGLDIAALARLDVTGGNIRNIAVNAAFLAAQSNRAVEMEHIWHAARAEYAKIERPLPEAETRGWQ